jgi:aryl-alcohol dehydrogenase-like predicted oxidoreductase
MKTVPLGPDDTTSALMMGTMTFGTQTPEDDAHRQLDLAADHGVTWLDTAEMYPVNPVRAETVGLTEEIVGRWIAGGGRGRMRVATKISGAGGAARGGDPITPGAIRESVEASLSRLRIEAVDLYQLHWPNRGSYHFRQCWTYRPKGERDAVLQDMADTAGALSREVERGTVRAFGLSNETAWGMAQWSRLAEEGTGPRPIALQNEYSLLCRLADTDISELLHHDDVTMLAYSPLAAGLLTGKYQEGEAPEGSRMSINGDLGGRWTPRAQPAVQSYLDLAMEHGVDPVQMALAWLLDRPFRCVPIVGATTSVQLEHILGSVDVSLSEELAAAIDSEHKAHPMPY